MSLATSCCILNISWTNTKTSRSFLLVDNISKSIQVFPLGRCNLCIWTLFSGLLNIFLYAKLYMVNWKLVSTYFCVRFFAVVTQHVLWSIISHSSVTKSIYQKIVIQTLCNSISNFSSTNIGCILGETSFIYLIVISSPCNSNNFSASGCRGGGGIQSISFLNMSEKDNTISEMGRSFLLLTFWV